MLIGLDLARAGLVSAIALTGPPLPLLSLLLFAVMLLGTPFAAAWTALVRNARPAGHGPVGLQAGALSWQARALSWRASQAFGFLLGAAAVAVLQPRRALLIDAATLVVSACLRQPDRLARRRRASATVVRDQPAAW